MRFRPALSDADNARLAAWMLRVGAVAIMAFQIAYLVLDAIEFPRTFAATVSLHIAGLVLGLVLFVTALSPRYEIGARDLTDDLRRDHAGRDVDRGARQRPRRAR